MTDWNVVILELIYCMKLTLERYVCFCCNFAMQVFTVVHLINCLSVPCLLKLSYFRLPIFFSFMIFYFVLATGAKGADCWSTCSCCFTTITEQLAVFLVAGLIWYKCFNGSLISVTDLMMFVVHTVTVGSLFFRNSPKAIKQLLSIISIKYVCSSEMAFITTTSAGPALTLMCPWLAV